MSEDIISKAYTNIYAHANTNTYEHFYTHGHTNTRTSLSPTGASMLRGFLWGIFRK